MTSPPPSAPNEVPSAQLPERIGPFRILGVLGRGGMGVVFDAETTAGERIALKIIRPVGDAEQSGTLVARFLREARILEQLDHPSVVRLVDAGDLDGMLYLAMERIEGVSLLAIRRQGPLTFDPLVQLGAQLLDALQHLHEVGVVHRDIKPANVLIKPDGRPVITDFGISGMSEATGITRQGDLLGSPGFMAPEVVNGASPTPLADQYALGRLLFELGARGASRRLPKKAPIFEILRIAMEIDWARFPKEDAWPQLAKVLERMLARDPADRYQQAAEAESALLALRKGVLDVDTLSEHVDQLALPSSTSWEALAVDLVEEGTADALLSDLELPAGLQARSDKPPWAGVEATLPLLPEGAVGFIDSAPDTPAIAAPMPSTGAPSMEEAAEGASADLSAPPPSPFGPPIQNPQPRRPSDPTLPPGPTKPPGDGLPLSELLRRRDAAAPQAGADPSSEASRVDMLERQLTRTREDLAAARQAALPIRRTPWAWIAAIAATAVVGLVAGTFLPRGDPPIPQLVLVPSETDNLVPAKFEYGKTAPPSLQDREDAKGLLAQAQAHQRRRDLDAAERLLGLCIDVADLPDCHKTLATLLTLTGEPAARTHFERYLELAPEAPDAIPIRQYLGEP